MASDDRTRVRRRPTQGSSRSSVLAGLAAVALLAAACSGVAPSGATPPAPPSAAGDTTPTAPEASVGDAPGGASGPATGAVPGAPPVAVEDGPDDDAVAASGELEVHVLDVGQAEATLLLHPDATVLIDTGGHLGDEVVPALRRLGVERLDLVVVSHPHADHLGQFDRVLASFDVAEVWWSGTVATTRTFERAVAALERSTAAYEEPRAGDRARIGPLTLDVLHPRRGADVSDAHDGMLVVRVTFGDVRFLFTGDAEADVEARLLADPGSVRAEVLKVGHHGSRTSTTSAFLAAVAPRVAVYAAGVDNRYGHPHPEVIERLRASGAEVVGTDRDGTVVLTTDGRAITVRVGG